MRLKTLARTGLGALLVAFALTGCADSMAEKKEPKNNQNDQNQSQTNDEESTDDQSTIDTEKYNKRFQRNVEKITKEFQHSGKRDFLGLQSPCEVLGPIADEDEKFDMKMGVYVEMSGEFNVGPKLVLGGADVVLDLYHHQLTVSTFKGDGFTTSAGVSGGVSMEAGFAHGFKKWANNWNGYFATVEFDFSLPFLKEFAEGNAGTFVGATDLDDSGKIDQTEEIGEPGENVFGGYVGISVSAGYDPLLGASPVTANAQQAFWKQNKEATKHLHEQLNGKVFNFFEIDPRLVQKDGSPCPAGWPNAGTGEGCVIEFGEDGDSHVKRGLETAAALCVVSAGCTAVPLTAPATIHALSIGAIRDAESNIENYCEDDGWF